MNILIIHAHNDNRGDEAAVKALVDELLIKYPDANITISLNGYTEYPNMPSNVRQIGRFPKLNSRKAQVEFFIIYATNGHIAFSNEARSFLHEVKNADVILHAPGGPSIGDTYLNAEKLYLWRLDLIRRMGKKYIFYAPSMGPFNIESRNQLRKKVISNATRIIVRDPISYGYVKTLLPDEQVTLALDSALQHDVEIKTNQDRLNEYDALKTFIDNHSKCVGITITDLLWHPKHKNKEYIKNIERSFQMFINKVIDDGYGIVFIPQLYGRHNDISVMSKYLRKEHTFIVDADLEKYDAYFQQFLISKLYAVVGMRYHSNIFSAKMGTPFIAISYEQKTKGFMQSIQLGEYCIDIEKLSYEKLVEEFLLLEKNHEDYKRHLKNIHDEMKEKAYISTKIVIDVLEGNND